MTARLFAAVFVVVLVLVLDGTAFAYWGGAGSGAGTGSTGVPLSVGLSPATPAAGLYPGGTTAVALVASNQNTFTVRIDSLALDTGRGTGGFAVDAGHSGCATSALSFTTQTNGTGWTVPRKIGVVGLLTITLTGALAMSASAANACQGASITVYLVVGS